MNEGKIAEIKVWLNEMFNASNIVELKITLKNDKDETLTKKFE